MFDIILLVYIPSQYFSEAVRLALQMYLTPVFPLIFANWDGTEIFADSIFLMVWEVILYIYSI